MSLKKIRTRVDDIETGQPHGWWFGKMCSYVAWFFLTFAVLLVIILILSRYSSIALIVERIKELKSGKIVDRFPRCQIDMSDIQGALEEYKFYYSHFPTNPDAGSLEFNNRTLMMILSGDQTNAIAIRENPRCLTFISLGESNLSHTWNDPWMHPYHIIVMTNSTGILLGGNFIQRDILIWSDGPNGIDEKGNGDDLCSWKLNRH